jgi:hypothetical protein
MLKTLFPQNLSEVSFTNPTSTVGSAVSAKPLITEGYVQMHKQLCGDHKTWA